VPRRGRGGSSYCRSPPSCSSSRRSPAARLVALRQLGLVAARSGQVDACMIRFGYGVSVPDDDDVVRRSTEAVGLRCPCSPHQPAGNTLTRVCTTVCQVIRPYNDSIPTDKHGFVQCDPSITRLCQWHTLTVCSQLKQRQSQCRMRIDPGFDFESPIDTPVPRTGGRQDRHNQIAEAAECSAPAAKPGPCDSVSRSGSEPHAEIRVITRVGSPRFDRLFGTQPHFKCAGRMSSPAARHSANQVEHDSPGRARS